MDITMETFRDPFSTMFRTTTGEERQNGHDDDQDEYHEHGELNERDQRDEHDLLPKNNKRPGFANPDESYMGERPGDPLASTFGFGPDGMPLGDSNRFDGWQGHKEWHAQNIAKRGSLDAPEEGRTPTGREQAPPIDALPGYHYGFPQEHPHDHGYRDDGYQSARERDDGYQHAREHQRGYEASKVKEHGVVEMTSTPWYHAESNRIEQEELAAAHIRAIADAMAHPASRRTYSDLRWTNDPEVFPDLDLIGGTMSAGLLPFPPHDQQFYICGFFDPKVSQLKSYQRPSHCLDQDGNSLWVRLSDFGEHNSACHLFKDGTSQMLRATHCGRIIQGQLDMGYFIEALQAVSLRPKLARQLFYAWDTKLATYIVRLWKHGAWMRVEVDDYVPVAPIGDKNLPLCCRSEHFPSVLWPSIVEKAYAKVHTIRGDTSNLTEIDRGGWEAIGGGGRVEEALADLTGGVAGRFHTCDVTADRLFLYIHDLQRDTLFVVRPHEANCNLHGVHLNPYFPHAVNRAVDFEGRPYIQVFCGAPGIYDGGLQDLSIPYGLIHCQDYPERNVDGFFWIHYEDFHFFFDTIIECRLVNSGDVSIVNMPKSRLPGLVQTIPQGPSLLLGPGGVHPHDGIAGASVTAGLHSSASPLRRNLSRGSPLVPGSHAGMVGVVPRQNAPGSRQPPHHPSQHPSAHQPTTTQNASQINPQDISALPQAGTKHISPEGDPVQWAEWVFANRCETEDGYSIPITRENQPEFSIRVPETQVPCEIICSVEQRDARMRMKTSKRQEQAAILVKVYEAVDRQMYRSKIVCKSNWLPMRDSMVACLVEKGCELLLVAELQNKHVKVEGMIFRCYASRPGVVVSAMPAGQKHALVETHELPRALKWTLVGGTPHSRLADLGIPEDEPEPYDGHTDSMRKPQWDMRPTIADLTDDCSVM